MESGVSVRPSCGSRLGADLQILDANPKTLFDVFPVQYAKQLAAGYSRMLPDKRLVVYLLGFG